MGSLLIAGGQGDPNLLALRRAAQSEKVDVIDLRLPSNESPAFSWDLDKEAVTLSTIPVSPSGAFLRYDVFAALEAPRPEVSARSSAWFQTVDGWILSSPRIRTFNRNMSQTAANKPAVLTLARRAGLRVPSTLVSNTIESLASHGESWIAKPVAGGDYCYTLPEARAKSPAKEGPLPMPAILQERLEQPEIRIYVIGEQAFAFEVRSESLDYRIGQDAAISLLAQPPAETGDLRALMSELGMEFGAADFKMNRQQKLVFLELNTSPMFARFDEISQGRLTAAMIHEVMRE